MSVKFDDLGNIFNFLQSLQFNSFTFYKSDISVNSLQSLQFKITIFLKPDIFFIFAQLLQFNLTKSTNDFKLSSVMYSEYSQFKYFRFFAIFIILKFNVSNDSYDINDSYLDFFIKSLLFNS